MIKKNIDFSKRDLFCVGVVEVEFGDVKLPYIDSVEISHDIVTITTGVRTPIEIEKLENKKRELKIYGEYTDVNTSEKITIVSVAIVSEVIEVFRHLTCTDMSEEIITLKVLPFEHHTMVKTDKEILQEKVDTLEKQLKCMETKLKLELSEQREILEKRNQDLSERIYDLAVTVNKIDSVFK